MEFIIPGKIKPYVRMTQRGKWINPQAREYLESKKAIAWIIAQQMRLNEWEMLPGQTPLTVSIEFEQPRALHRADLDNQVKAILDAAQGVVYQNDCWVDCIQASRRLGTHSRVTLRVEKNRPVEAPA